MDANKDTMKLTDGFAANFEESFVATDSAEAYSAIALMSTLVFGFATSNIISVLSNNMSGSNVTMFVLLMSISCVLSAYGMVVMTLQFYHIKRLTSLPPEFRDQLISKFLSETFVFRNISRGLTWISLALYMFAMPFYALNNDQQFIFICMFFVFTLGACMVIAVWRMLSTKYVRIYDSVYKKPS